jgi:hypothetical protein
MDFSFDADLALQHRSLRRAMAVVIKPDGSCGRV